MTNAIATQPDQAEVIEQVVIAGDLARLNPAQRVTYYRQVCDSLGLNPFTRPFDYITLNGKLTLYAKRDAADQLRKLHGVSVQIVSRERVDDVYVVTAHAAMPDGRSDESIGAVTIINLKGDALANALMKAETKAKRRVTLSIVGLGWLDETEIETIRDARPVMVDTETGEILTGASGRPAAVVTTTPQPAAADALIARWQAEQKNFTHAPMPANGNWGATQQVLAGICGGGEERHRFMSLLFGRQIASANDLTAQEAAWLQAFVKARKAGDSWAAEAQAEQSIASFMQRHPAAAPDFPAAADLTIEPPF